MENEIRNCEMELNNFIKEHADTGKGIRYAVQYKGTPDCFNIITMPAEEGYDQEFVVVWIDNLKDFHRLWNLLKTAFNPTDVLLKNPNDCFLVWDESLQDSVPYLDTKCDYILELFNGWLDY